MNGMYKNNTTKFSNAHHDTSPYITKISHQLYKHPKATQQIMKCISLGLLIGNVFRSRAKMKSSQQKG